MSCRRVCYTKRRGAPAALSTAHGVATGSARTVPRSSMSRAAAGAVARIRNVGLWMSCSARWWPALGHVGGLRWGTLVACAGLVRGRPRRGALSGLGALLVRPGACSARCLFGPVLVRSRCLLGSCACSAAAGGADDLAAASRAGGPWSAHRPRMCHFSSLVLSLAAANRRLPPTLVSMQTG